MAMSVMEIHADSISDLLAAEPHRRLEVKKVRPFPVKPCLWTNLRETGFCTIVLLIPR